MLPDISELSYSDERTDYSSDHFMVTRFHVCPNTYSKTTIYRTNDALPTLKHYFVRVTII